MGAAHNLSSESESKTESKSQDASIERDGSANPERSNIQLQLDPELESTTKVDKKENDDDQDDGFTTVSRFRYASVDRGGWGGRGGRGRGRKNRKGHGQSRVGGIHGGEGHAQAPIYSEEDQSREAVNQRLERRLGIVNAKRRVVQESKFWTAFLGEFPAFFGWWLCDEWQRLWVGSWQCSLRPCGTERKGLKKMPRIL